MSLAQTQHKRDIPIFITPTKLWTHNCTTTVHARVRTSEWHKTTTVNNNIMTKRPAWRKSFTLMMTLLWTTTTAHADGKAIKLSTNQRHPHRLLSRNTNVHNLQTKHPAATRRHICQGHICHFCHCLHENCLRCSSTDWHFIVLLGQTPPQAIVSRTVPMIVSGVHNDSKLSVNHYPHARRSLRA